MDWAARVTLRRLAQDVERPLLLRAGHPFAGQRCKMLDGALLAWTLRWVEAAA